MKKALLAVITVVVLAHVVLFGAVAIRGSAANGEPSPSAPVEPAKPTPPPTPSKPIGSPNEVSAEELLQEFTKTISAALSSFIIKTETSEDWDISFSGAYEHHSAGHTGRQIKHQLEEIRGDWLNGQRGKRIAERWGGKPHAGGGRPRSRSERGYISWVWDGKDWCQYARNPRGPRHDRVFYRVNSMHEYPPGWSLGPLETFFSSRCFSGGRVFGYLEGDDERIDAILSRATEIGVRDHFEPIRGVDCYVIDARTSRGNYTVWLDPAHGYNIARATVVRKGGDDWYYKMSVPMGCTLTPVVENLQFEQFDGVWVPVKAKMSDIRNFDNGDYGRIIKHYQVDEFIRNPDHDALGAFLHDDIRDGAIVHLVGIDPKGPEHRWRKGTYVYDPTAD
jgi:hypothetical protein